MVDGQNNAEGTISVTAFELQMFDFIKPGMEFEIRNTSCLNISLPNISRPVILEVVRTVIYDNPNLNHELYMEFTLEHLGPFCSPAEKLLPRIVENLVEH